MCNLNCRYCEDFGARRNAEHPPPLPLPQAQKLLAIIRQATDSLILTGGEPLLYPDLEALVAYAKQNLRFRNLTIISNGTLLDRYLPSPSPGFAKDPKFAQGLLTEAKRSLKADRPNLLDHIDRLIISLDSVDTELWQTTLRAAPGTAAHILDNIKRVARLQKGARVSVDVQRDLIQQKSGDDAQRKHGFRLIIHCVVTPETLAQAKEVLNFCVEHDIGFSFSPQSVNNWPHYDLLTSEAYRALVSHVIQAKRHGAPVLGSLPYLRTMYTFETYACYPLLAPRVMADGTLSYPCRPIERNQDTHGGRRVNLLEVESWQTAIEQARAYYGDPPSMCSSCFQQCYVEPSLMQTHPLALLWELLRFPVSRRARIHTYAPG
jgi:MoaA/NifB/PqqE/SkfB family radical SAM enzyme